MNIRDVKYVHVSELFEGTPAEFWDAFQDGFDDITFGDCNYSLVTRERLIDKIEDTCDFLCEEWANTFAETLRKRLKELPDGVYIDMEN